MHSGFFWLFLLCNSKCFNQQSMPTVHNPKRPWIKARPKPVQKNQGGDRANRDVYDTSRWRKVRKLFLDANPLCHVCKAQNRIVEATVVDHHVPINDGADPWDESNWRPMCHTCHQKKRATERRDRR